MARISGFAGMDPGHGRALPTQSIDPLLCHAFCIPSVRFRGEGSYLGMGFNTFPCFKGRLGGEMSKRRDLGLPTATRRTDQVLT